jgi:penicillin-binding protein 1A
MLVDLGGWRGAVPLDVGRERLNPQKKKPSERFARNDLVRVRLAPDLPPPRLEGAKETLALDLGPQGAVVVLDPTTREVKAMVGGYDFQTAGFNRATRAKRQPGSAFKPFVFAAAIDGTQLTAASIINDAPEVYDLWKPKNYEAGKFRGPIRLRDALALSINTVAIRVMHEVTPPRAAQLARSMGIHEELPEEMSLALGSGVVTPLDMTNAYATFAAGGKTREPVFIKAIDGIPEKQEPETQVLRPEVAYVMTSLMTSVVQEGTATAAKKLKREIAGKTGTSNSGRDAWFVGYTPDLVCGVWVGYDDMRALGKKETGGRAALPVFVETMRTALKGQAARTFSQPPGVVVARIDRRTGLLAAPDAAESEVVDEVFLDGTAPTETAPSAGEVDPSTFVLEQFEDDEERASEAPPESPN